MYFGGKHKHCVINKMKYIRNKLKFQWIGEGIPFKRPLKRRGNKIRYESFCVDDLKINVEDFVLVRNDDALDPEDVMTCFVAQVKDLFDTGDELDPYKAQVQWFSRIPELPAYTIEYFSNIGHNYEIVKDKRSSWFDIIDAETVFQKCEVIFLDLDADYESALLKYDDHPFPVFFCRYVFTGTSVFSVMKECKQTVLKPSNLPVANENVHMNGFNSYTDGNAQNGVAPVRTFENTVKGYIPHAVKNEENSVATVKSRSFKNTDKMYRAIPIGDPNCPKVLIKRIDDRILEDKNGSVRVFVADPKMMVIDDVTDIVLKKLALEKKAECNINIEKRPIIHTFTSENASEEHNYGTNGEFMNNDNVETETVETPKTRSYICKGNENPLSNKLCRKVSALAIRSSLRKSTASKNTSESLTPQKKAKVNFLDDFCLLQSKEYKHETNHEFINNNSNIETETVKTPRTRSRSTCGGNETPLSNKLCKRVSALSIRSSPRKSTSLEIPVDCLTSQKKAKVSHVVDDLSLTKLEEQEHKTNSEYMNKDSSVETETVKIRRSRRSHICKESEIPLSDKLNKKVSTLSIKSSPKKLTAIKNPIESLTPQKKAKVLDDFCLTRSGRRVKCTNYSEFESDVDYKRKVTVSTISPTKKKMPNFVCNSSSYESDCSNFSGAEECNSDDSSLSNYSLLDERPPVKLNCRKSLFLGKKSSRKVSTTKISSKKNSMSLCIPERKTPLKIPQNSLEESRQRLHVSAVPDSLPCREEEYSDIYNFVKGCLWAKTGGCMYISGVPGTGKTATVHEVMRNLEGEKKSGDVPIFTFVEVNGMWMTDPYQCYVQVFKALNGKSIAPQQAADLLEKRFTEAGPKKEAVVLLVDELDRLWTRKQTVMYNIFDWPTKKNSKLIVLAIANTMDLPERMMLNRIASRLGLTRKTFQPYTFKQLQEIIMSRIQELKVFDPDAVQLVARKVAAVSGDARRALDICRCAAEMVKVGQSSKRGQKVLVGMEHVDMALQQMFSSPLISAIRSSSKISKLFFQCMLSEFTRTGLEETTLLKVYQQVVAYCRFEGLHPPNSSEFSRICTDLAASHLILVDNFRNDLHMKIRLNVSSDDVTYALTLH